MQLNEIQNSIKEAGLSGWLFYDFRGCDPLSAKILKLDPARHLTRRWFYYIPAEGEATKIVHSIEPAALEALPGKTLTYLPWQQLHKCLQETLREAKSVAMQYSPQNAIPYVSRVDAGTIELIRSFGVAVCSSADLIQQFEARLSDQQYRTHQYAAEKISDLIDETFSEIKRRIETCGHTSEFEIQQFMCDCYKRDGLISDYPPIVAAAANSADPHYMPSKEKNAPISAGELVLIDTWAKQDIQDSIYFDVTWTAFTAKQIPAEIENVFQIVHQARDKTIEYIRLARQQQKSLAGWQVDQTARDVIQAAGYQDHFIHRSGHSIHCEVHGNGANMDNLETRDERLILPRTLFSIEPGIYLKGKFGIRSEVNVYISENDAIVTGRDAQTEVIKLDCKT